MKRSAIAAMTWLLCSSCGEQEPVEIRFENASAHTFDSLNVGFGETAAFGELRPGEQTEYREFDDAYRYGYVRVVVGRDEYEIRPIDFVGESHLDPGKYTHRLQLGPAPAGLSGATRPDK